jgi:hypothetical protein
MSEKNTCIPNKIISRNEYGLICSPAINYVYGPDDLIDWRKMINPKHLVPNKLNFERYNKPVPKTIEGLEDKDLMILLAGIKELAQIRGYNSVEYTTSSPASDYVIATCTMSWIPNFETEGRIIKFTSIGDASPYNTTSFAKNYLGPIAENRAFVRCVRNFLRINIVSQEEIGGSPSQDTEAQDSSSSLLKEVMAANSVTFEKIKEKLIEEKFDGAQDLKSVSDIPKFKQFELIERIKKKAASKKK